ncbi:hypothetical protein RRF57_012751 [Xylaria bambusicola]|uniref:Uncharacterized protein n=1 Tax=Xylaria bambusicola TaxID=326684 RepID=A0AAN7V5Y3_9PEZI
MLKQPIPDCVRPRFDIIPSVFVVKDAVCSPDNCNGKRKQECIISTFGRDITGSGGGFSVDGDIVAIKKRAPVDLYDEYWEDNKVDGNKGHAADPFLICGRNGVRD